MTTWLLAALLASQPAASYPPCTFETSASADVRQIRRSPEKWFGRCVRLEGYVSFNRFYQDVAGYYRSKASDRRGRPNDGWLGLYFRNNDDWQKPMRRATVVGTVGSCERSYEAAAATLGPNQIVFMTGYCHYTGGLVLYRAEPVFAGGARFTGQTSEKAREAFGDLETESTAGAIPAEVIARTMAWKTAFRAGNGTALRSLVHPYDWTEEEKPDLARRFEAVLKGDEGPFSALLGRRLEPVFFREKLDKNSRSEGNREEWFACFCKTGNCAGRWPIAVMDAIAVDGRPYVCLRIFESLDGKRNLQLGMEIVDNDLIEP